MPSPCLPRLAAMLSVVLLLVFGCAEDPPGSTDQPTDSAYILDTFAASRLFASGAGGCGLTLRDASSRGLLLFKGQDDDFAMVAFDGDLRQLPQTQFEGEEFYGNHEMQTFADGLLTVRVKAELSDDPGPETTMVTAQLTVLLQDRRQSNRDAVGTVGC